MEAHFDGSEAGVNEPIDEVTELYELGDAFDEVSHQTEDMIVEDMIVEDIVAGGLRSCAAISAGIPASCFAVCIRSCTQLLSGLCCAQGMTAMQQSTAKVVRFSILS